MSPKVPMEHKEQRQREILMASKEVFAKKGYEAASIKDIMDAVSISRGGIYAYFSNKEHIFLSLLEQIMEDSRLEVEDLLQKNGSVWETILFILNGYLNIKNHPQEETFSAAIMEYGLTHWRKPENKDYIAKRYNSGAEIFCSLIEKGIEAGEFVPASSPVHISRFMISFFDGIIISSLALEPNILFIDEQIHLMEEALKTMLNVQKPEKSKG